MATPTAPNPAEIEAAPVLALMTEVSIACTRITPATIPAPLSPTISAVTAVADRFSVLAPAPLNATPTRPPAAATDPAKTVALIFSFDLAVIERSPVAVTWERSSLAVTSEFEVTRSIRFHSAELP